MAANCKLVYHYSDGTQSTRDVEAETCYTVPAGTPKDVEVVDVISDNGYGEVETYGKRGCRTKLEEGQTPLHVTKHRIYSSYILSCP
ncbi:hypothetical protein BGW38_006161 [Lunasporangiospora selenospora]|uniref:Uncharacterized protein n=1 Tax=Lunasporangiospora selenospora TaxID=979761 RepID=A0A9P6FP14_9FUNG|nr:hypothetical protein BGW38_006161 [Lunasporangiospora selenospora]